MTGVVSDFQWTNPHVYIELEVPDGKGGSTHYSVECASVNVLTRAGWKFNDIKKGDKVTLLINPLRNVKPGGMLETATLKNDRQQSAGRRLPALGAPESEGGER